MNKPRIQYVNQKYLKEPIGEFTFLFVACFGFVAAVAVGCACMWLMR